MAVALPDINLDDLKIEDTTAVKALDLFIGLCEQDAGALGINAMSNEHKLVFLLGFKKIKDKLLEHKHVSIKTAGIVLEVFHDNKNIREHQYTLKRISGCLAAMNVISYVIGKVNIANIAKCAFAASITSEDSKAADIISIGLTPGVALTIEILNCHSWDLGPKDGFYVPSPCAGAAMEDAICMLVAGAMAADDRAAKGTAKVEPNSLVKSILARAEVVGGNKCVGFLDGTAKKVSTQLNKLKATGTRKDKLSADWLRLVHGKSAKELKTVGSTWTGLK